MTYIHTVYYNLKFNLLHNYNLQAHYYNLQVKENKKFLNIILNITRWFNSIMELNFRDTYKSLKNNIASVNLSINANVSV